MHCYLDLFYQNWLMDRQPSSIPMAPIVTDQSPTSVSIYWLPPIRGPLYQRYDYVVLIINYFADAVHHQPKVLLYDVIYFTLAHRWVKKGQVSLALLVPPPLCM